MTTTDETALRERLYAISRLVEPLTDTPDDNSLIAYAIQKIAQGVTSPAEAVAALGDDWSDVLADLARNADEGA